MAIKDLINSLNKLINFLKRTHDPFWVKILEEHKSSIIISYKKGEINDVKKSVNKLKSYFNGMGSLSDLIICRENRNVPKGLSENRANRILERLLNELYMWCYFWEMETETAKKLYAGYLKVHKSSLPPYLSRSGEKIENYIKKYPRRKK